ncbi:MAG: serine/threonine protein kinase [Caldilineae bacterium]|nr:MAG: serine/threonine protein kinase [Caldilineae bacterium]
MNQLLRPGQTAIAQTSGLTCVVERFLGGGGQGEVYAARLTDPAQNRSQTPVALKWYFPHYLRQDGKLEQRLHEAIRVGPPSDRFLWPQELVRAPDLPGFGYVMPLREARFAGITDLVMRRVEPTFRALVTAGFELAHSYLQLHAKGLCYRDISFGNVFFDPATGEVRICDNDNVGVDRQATGGIGGTARFMAPEIVRGEAVPSIQTDLFSLAVLLFYMLVNHHPLEGAREAQIHCFDLPAMTRLYGQEPLFIFDPTDDRNRPLPGYHDNALALWPVYPQFIRDLFTRAFTTGLWDPDNGRVRESEWRAALVRLRDSIMYCTGCGAENFYDREALRQGRNGVCWACNSVLRPPPRMRLDREIVLLNHDTVLYPHHLDEGERYNFSQPVARVVQHPQNPQIWGLQNLSEQKWVSYDAGGKAYDVLPGQTVTLSSGERIHFGRREGEIRF